jgi:hypothetical protein
VEKLHVLKLVLISKEFRVKNSNLNALVNVMKKLVMLSVLDNITMNQLYAKLLSTTESSLMNKEENL